MNKRKQLENAKINRHEARLIFREKIIAIKVFIETINDLVQNKVMKYIHKVFIKYHKFLVYKCSLKKKVPINTRNTTLNTISNSFFVVSYLPLVSWRLRYNKV